MEEKSIDSAKASKQRNAGDVGKIPCHFLEEKDILFARIHEMSFLEEHEVELPEGSEDSFV